MQNTPSNDQTYADKITTLCIEQYNKLPKTGKPTEDEWTVAAAIVEESEDTLKVVSFATGSKCVGAKALMPDGSVLHDAHAEVLARRGFLIYLMEEIKAWHSGKSKIFKGIVNGKLVFCDDVKYTFFASSVPCGDAAIIPMEHSISERKRNANEEGNGNSPEVKRRRESDVHRTGAKCLPQGGLQDPKLKGDLYHVTGQVRTKPGRGDPTASVSCSDKLARWSGVGMQGALLSMFLLRPAVTFHVLVIAGGVPFSFETLTRAINARLSQQGYNPTILQSTIEFPTAKSEKRKRPAPCSTSWNSVCQQVQVCVEGKKSGVTKKSKVDPALNISKKLLFKSWQAMVQGMSESARPMELYNVNLEKISYREAKDVALAYQTSWKLLKEEYFKVWAIKPSGLELFSCTS